MPKKKQAMLARLYLTNWCIPTGWPASAGPSPYASDDLLIKRIMQKHGFTEEQAIAELIKFGELPPPKCRLH
jgi:hypothetical protein